MDGGQLDARQHQRIPLADEPTPAKSQLLIQRCSRKNPWDITIVIVQLNDGRHVFRLIALTARLGGESLEGRLFNSRRPLRIGERQDPRPALPHTSARAGVVHVSNGSIELDCFDPKAIRTHIDNNDSPIRKHKTRGFLGREEFLFRRPVGNPAFTPHDGGPIPRIDASGFTPPSLVKEHDPVIGCPSRHARFGLSFTHPQGDHRVPRA